MEKKYDYVCPECGHEFRQGEYGFDYDTALLYFRCPECEWEGSERDVADKDWHEISALLADTSEEKHLTCDWCMETDEDMGLSSLQKLHIVEIWQDEKEGIITFKLEGCDEEFDLSDYEEFIPQVRMYLES
jgi:DNA-directed RNA polymerase subunit RPC12/RpoP